ncbi:hypothetical protein RhoFasSB10_03956 [Rhodococcus fascians]|uniref:hypothetical protein n=1 Tax=Rhodococcoides fascians TaxID=1828 RepID=UPI001427C0E8|nr:hypothetical protein [Rhodococcus fascians]
MSSSDKYDAETIRKMRATATSAAAQMPQYKLDPQTVSAVSSLVDAVGPLDSYRHDMLKQMSPIIESMNQMNKYKMELVTPGLAQTITELAEISSMKQQFAAAPWLQELSATMNGFEPVVLPELTNVMREMIGTSLISEQFAHNLFSSPAITQAIQSMNVVNEQVNSFAESFAKSVAPVMEGLRTNFEQTKIFDNFDFSVLDDVDEEAFEDFLEEHPELEETYESIEQTMVEHGLISEGMFAKVSARFKSSRVAKQAMVALLLLSLSTVMVIAGSNLPDDRQDDALAFGTVLALLYGMYAVHAKAKSAKPEKPAME